MGPGGGPGGGGRAAMGGPNPGGVPARDDGWDAYGEDRMKTQGEASHPQTKDCSLQRNQLDQPLDLGLLASRPARKSISVLKRSSLGSLFWEPLPPPTEVRVLPQRSFQLLAPHLRKRLLFPSLSPQSAAWSSALTFVVFLLGGWWSFHLNFKVLCFLFQVYLFPTYLMASRLLLP